MSAFQGLSECLLAAAAAVFVCVDLSHTVRVRVPSGGGSGGDSDPRFIYDRCNRSTAPDFPNITVVNI